jgi:thiol:disulfide interchange protein DsbC
MLRFALTVFALALVALAPQDAQAFGDMAGACEPDCSKCHRVTREEAGRIVKEVSPDVEVLGIQNAPVGGLWELTVRAKGMKGLAYLDFAKKHIITGSIIEVGTRKNITGQRLYDVTKVDLSQVPLEGALVLGDPDAPLKAVVFTDPDCPYCRKLHRELKRVTRERADIAFYIILFPLPSHPDAYRKSKAVLCDGSLPLLERALDGAEVGEPACETDIVDRNIELANKLGITSTPTIILPDGGVVPGFRDAAALIGLIEESGGRAGAEGEGQGGEAPAQAEQVTEPPAPQQPKVESE